MLAVCRAKGMTYGKFINYEKGKTKPKTIFMAVIVIIIVGMAGMQIAGLLVYGEMPHFPLVMIQPIPMWIAIANILLLPLTTTLAEDGLYLGVINQTGSKFVLAASAFFYALQHSFIPLIPDAGFIAYRFLSFLPLTIIMCVWYNKTKNPLPFMVGHFIINLATVAQIVMISASPDIFEI
ncbi:MAG: CPBP family glutamic-type intramembrane protease [Defluviitaleaceae bacterium]|nr:CPBP family glutamic-type intramembrane protease [Defluviitaleaceae bacterium]